MVEDTPCPAGMRGGPPRRVLFFGWGAAASRVLDELSVYATSGQCVVHCVSHCSQASDVDLRDTCARHTFACNLVDTDEEVLACAQNFAPDLIISSSYRKKLQVSVLNLCEDCINFHPSLLPRHRGCWSGFWAIFEGDSETGVTCHRMVEAFDEGRILHQEQQLLVDRNRSIIRGDS